MNLNYPWHQNALDHIEQQIAENRQPHATLFRWRADYDDNTLGWKIIKCLLTDSPSASEPCKHCRLIDDNAHPNVLFLDVINDKIGIDNVRDLEQQMWQTSMFDKPKVAYIQGMDLLSLGAQNALLKTLEEPPKNTFFVLSVANISRVLPTIMSRVHRLHHGKFEQSSLLHWLQNQLSTTMTDAEIAKTAKLVNYSPMSALELLTSPESIKRLEKEKAQFAQFMSGKCSASILGASLEKTQAPAQLQRFCRYTENMIHFLFEKTADKNNELPNKRANNAEGNSVQYVTWNGVSLRALHRLHDTLMQLRQLADTNVSLPMQFTTSLTDWQNERRK